MNNFFFSYPAPDTTAPGQFQTVLNPPGSAVDTRIGQAVSLPPFPSQYSPIKVPLSSMNPFWMQTLPVPPAHAPAYQALAHTPALMPRLLSCPDSCPGLGSIVLEPTRL
jgi:hypothetical protein